MFIVQFYSRVSKLWKHSSDIGKRFETVTAAEKAIIKNRKKRIKADLTYRVVDENQLEMFEGVAE